LKVDRLLKSIYSSLAYQVLFSTFQTANCL